MEYYTTMRDTLEEETASGHDEFMTLFERSRKERPSQLYGSESGTEQIDTSQELRACIFQVISECYVFRIQDSTYFANRSLGGLRARVGVMRDGLT